MRLLKKKSLRKKLTEKFGGSLQFVIIGSKADIWWENNCWLPHQCGHWGRKGSQREIIRSAVFVDYSKAWWSPLNDMGTVLIQASTSSSVCFSLLTWKRHSSQEEVQLVSLLFTPQRQLTYRSKNSVEFHLKDLEWLSKDLRSLDWLTDLGIRPLRWTKSRVTTTEYQTSAISSWYKPALLNGQ